MDIDNNKFNWKPKIGDWFILKKSYCKSNSCSTSFLCYKCLNKSERHVISGKFEDEDYFFDGNWFISPHDPFNLTTICKVLTTDKSKVNRHYNIYHISDAIYIGRENDNFSHVHPDSASRGKALKYFRLNILGMGLRKFADYMGISPVHLSDIEHGREIKRDLKDYNTK